MGISQSLSVKTKKRSKFLDDILAEIIHIMDRGLLWEQTFLAIQGSLETYNNSQTTLLHKLGQQQDSLKYLLLLGFIFKLGIGTPKDEQQAFEHWKLDSTPYGYAL